MQDSVAPPGRGRKALRFIAFGAAVAVVLLAVAAFAFRNAAAYAALRSLGRGFGYDIAAGSLDVTLSSVRARDVRIRNAAGEPVLEARRIDVGYSLGDLLPGGKRLFGLESVAIASPHVTVIHHTDGSYNITLPQTVAKPAPSNGPPLNLALRLTDGSVDLIDRFVTPPRERRERLTDVHAAGVISPASGSYYHAGAALEDGAARYPIVGNARFDDPRGFELQRWTAARLPIAALTNFALSSHAIVVQAGELRHLDLKLGALATPAGRLQTHLGISAELSGGRIAATALAKPVRDARGSFVVDDDSATVRSLDASLGGIPLHLRGALYHFAAPQIAFGLTARGDLAQARELTRQSLKLPIAGTVTISGLVEGPAANPVVFARFSAPRVNYGTYRLDGARGLAAVAGGELDVVDAAIGYGTAQLTGRAAVVLQQHIQTTGYALVAVAPNGLPYVDNVLPGMPLRGIAAVSGRDGKLAARGYLGGVNGSDRLDAPFALDAGGSGTVGPVVLQRRDGASVYARAVLDGAANQTVGLVDVRGLSLLPAPAVALPGLRLPVLPARLDARLDATITGVARGAALTTANGALHAYGSWGDLAARADGTATRFAARGRLVSSFERLAAFTGDIGARGGIDVPFALANRGRSTIVQIQAARFPNARLRGLALQGASATLGIAPPAVDVYSADLRIAGRDITASGSFGAGGHVHVTAGDLDLRALRTAGVSVAGGHASVIADVGGSYAKPTATVLAALAGARYASTDVGGDVGLVYDGAALHIDRATLTYGGAYANATGTIAGLALGHSAPRYDLRAQLEDADIATLARTVKNPLRYPEGTLDADVRIGGAGARPTFTGDVQIPEGSINGLDFNGGRIAVSGNTTALQARDGRVTVGTTTLRFGGGVSRTQQSGRLRSQRIDLADFDDYFDAADVLAGTGSAALAFDATARALTASATVALSGTRYRRFDLGTVNAALNTAGTSVRVRATVAGSNGRANLAGTIDVPASDPIRDLARRSYLDLQGQLAGINLTNVLPAAGINAPVFGVVDASAGVRGRFPALALSARAALTQGVVGRVPIQTFTIAATAANGRGRLTDATLVAPGLTASALGSFGLRPDDAFDLRAQAASSDINELVASVTGKNPNLKGTLAARAQLSGTVARPRLASSVDVSDLAYSGVTVPAAHAEIDGTRQALDLRNGSLTLPLGGAISFDGHAPLGGNAATTPIALDFAPHHVDVAPYSALLPDGSVVAGIFDGNVGVRGTPTAPRLSGQLGLSGGSYRSNTLTSGLTAVDLELDFAGTSVKVARLHAHAAPGNIDGSGSLALRDLRDPIRGLTTNIDLTLANARVAAPKYYVGSVDGMITARKAVAAPLTIGGDVTLSSARIPYTALLPSGGSASSAAPALPDVAFDLGVIVARDVRIQSGPVDIGTTGKAQLGGTLAKPTLAGRFAATDGTVSLYRTFTVQNGSVVSFSPSDGITPTVDATAVTSVPDPPTDVLLRITGLSTHLNLAFSSQPSYSQQQILGLLVGVQALGAVSGVAQTNGSTGGASIAGLGAGVLNTQLTQRFLQPFSSKLGGALGLSDLDINYNLNGGVLASARRSLGKNISFVYGEQFGGPTPRTSIGINVGSAITSAQLTLYEAPGSQEAFGGSSLTPYSLSGFLSTQAPNYALLSIVPPNGSGFVFSYQRHFWTNGGFFAGLPRAFGFGRARSRHPSDGSGPPSPS